MNSNGNYYEILDIEKTADAQQIKRAYFGLVRKFPPERHPERFKLVRAAYETLSDTQKRNEYDRINDLPEAAVKMLAQANEAKRLKNYAKAEAIYKSLLKDYPKQETIKYNYAKYLDSRGNSGKALKLWEELCGNSPGNVRYMRSLADAYKERGWRKKAINEYLDVLELDTANADCWIALTDCYAECGEHYSAKRACFSAINALNAAGIESAHIYTRAFVFIIHGYEGSAEECIGNITRLIKMCDARQLSEYDYVLPCIINNIKPEDMPRYIKYITEMADSLPELDEELTAQVDAAELTAEVESLKKNGFPDLFHDLLATIIGEGYDNINYANAIMSMESVLLEEFDTYKQPLVRLKREYPKLYWLHSDFFDETLRTRNLNNMIRSRYKILSKTDIIRDFMNDTEAGANFEDMDNIDDFFQPTVFRDENKVGRNDPCPCGSGKKYKKCCGA